MKISKQVENAMKAAEAVLAERRKIRAAITEGDSQATQAGDDLQVALRALAEAETEAALSGKPAPAGSVRAVSDARTRLESAAARTVGLRARLLKSDEELLLAESALAEARREFKAAAVEEYRREYLAAAGTFAKVIRRGVGLAHGLGVKFAGLKSIRLPDLESENIELVKVFPQISDGGVWRSDWESDPDARTAFDAVSGPKATADRLAKETTPIRKAAASAAETEAQAAAAAARESGPKSSGLTFKPEPAAAIPKVTISGGGLYPDNPERRAGLPIAAEMYPDS